MFTWRGLYNLARYQAKYRSQHALARLQAKPRAHFLHINKTAGTSVRHALKGQESRYSLFLHPHRFHLSDVPRGDKFFFTLRDPIERFVSGFYCRQRLGRPRYFYPWTEAEAAAFNTFPTPNELAEAIAHDSRAVHAMQHVRHIQTRYRDWFHSEQYLLARAEDVLWVGHQSSLAEDFARLKIILDSPHATLPHDDAVAHKAGQAVDRQLSLAARENLRDWYAEDYQFIALCEEHFAPSDQVACAAAEV